MLLSFYMFLFHFKRSTLRFYHILKYNLAFGINFGKIKVSGNYDSKTAFGSLNEYHFSSVSKLYPCMPTGPMRHISPING